MFQKLLIANRGEIAVRVLRAARRIGIRTVAVYSDADREALHVRMADEAVRLGPAPAAQSYLDPEKVMHAALTTGADAVHPGYGFLAESAAFARRVQGDGLAWIGPSPEAMDAMGDKVAARANAVAAGVPVAPGTDALADADAAADAAERIGYPVMLKASAGGGGIGMRIVRSPDDIRSEFDSATVQAAAAFGVSDVFLEKFIERPRHIEVQVLGDEHGNVVHLYERECSIQRRHQKLVEESPSPALTDAEREEIGAKAVALARHVGYTNAGTMEFLFERGSDGRGRFYFNEMNTRLQVEHPVTELVTGIDLVEWQLRIAAGQALGFTQDDIRLQGHAFEARINAEDPRHDFRPSPGPVQALRLPDGRGLRVDCGIYEGWTVPADYDSLVLKLLSHAPSREGNVHRMRAALEGLAIEGFTTNLVLQRDLFAHPALYAGELSTRFLEEHGFLAHEGVRQERCEKQRVAALVAALVDWPGGGLAGVRLRQHIPPVMDRVPGRRDWGEA